MATITLNLDERTIKNGMAQVRIRISHRGSNCFIGTGVYVEPQYFQASSLYDPVHRKAQMAVEKRERITEQVQAIDDFILSVDRAELAHMSANDIRDRAGMCTRKHEMVRRVPKSNTSGDFLRWFDEFRESRRTAKTQDSYAYGLKVLRDYCDARRLRSLSLCDIDYARLSDFACWMMGTGRFKDATRHMVECYIRAAYKEAIRRRMVSRENDPYYDYSIKPVPLRKIDYLTAEQMKQLMSASLPTKGMQWARDLAVMSFCLCGANLLDLYEMLKPNKGVVAFVRHKVEGHYQCETEIRVEPELRTLIERYEGDGYMLHFKETYANYESFRHKIGHRMQELSKELGFVVNMAKVRRTWATTAGRLRVEELVIDKSMGHVVRTINANHYEDYDWSRTAEANRRVIDYVLAS